MPSGKTSKRWRTILERCVGRTDSIRVDTRNLITHKGSVSGEDKSLLSKLNDSAYFSSDETAGSAQADGRLTEFLEKTDAVDYGNMRHVKHPAHSDDEMLTVCNLYRESSIQDRSHRITRKRHQKVALRKKCNQAVNVRAVSDSSSTSDDDTCQHGVPHRSEEPGINHVARTSSVQMRRWEIRRQRKDLLHKRRSKGYHGETCCDNPLATP